MVELPAGEGQERVDTLIDVGGRTRLRHGVYTKVGDNKFRTGATILEVILLAQFVIVPNLASTDRSNLRMGLEMVDSGDVLDLAREIANGSPLFVT